jgi:hypothetical protein
LLTTIVRLLINTNQTDLKEPSYVTLFCII